MMRSSRKYTPLDTAEVCIPADYRDRWWLVPQQPRVLVLSERFVLVVLFVMINYSEEWRWWPLPLQGLVLLSHLFIAQIEYSSAHDYDFRYLYQKMRLSTLRTLEFWVFLAYVFDINALIWQINELAHGERLRSHYWQLVVVALLFIPNLVRLSNLIIRAGATLRNETEEGQT